MLLGGATVREVNVVRRHLCQVKGGGLARVAGGPVVTLVASDVIGGHAWDVGSGPTVADPTTCAEARSLLARYVPRLRTPPLHESLEPDTSAARGLRTRVIARPEDLAHAVARELAARFTRVHVLRPSVAPVSELAREYIARGRTLRAGEAMVRAAEPSLRVHATRVGRGGRSTHLAALVAADLAPGVAFLAAASDGVDGTSRSAGAVVDASLAVRVTRARLERSLSTFDTGSLLASAGMTLPPGPSGIDLADVHVLARPT
jgi:hydroxypyruvate reductase